MCTSEVFYVFVVDVNIEIENVDCMKNFQSVVFVIVGLLSTVSCMRRQAPPPPFPAHSIAYKTIEQEVAGSVPVSAYFFPGIDDNYCDTILSPLSIVLVMPLGQSRQCLAKKIMRSSDRMNGVRETRGMLG